MKLNWKADFSDRAEFNTITFNHKAVFTENLVVS